MRNRLEDRISDLAQFGAPLTLDPGSEAHAMLDVIARVHARRRQFDVEAEEISGSPLLSEIGKRQRLVSLAESALRDVSMIAESNGSGNLRETLDAIRRRASKLESRIHARPTEDSAAEAVRQTFLWDRLERVDALLRPELFFGAIENGDAATYNAFVEAPALLKLLPRDVIEQGVTLWNQQRDPATAAAVRDLRKVADRLESESKAVQEHIARVGGLAAADPLAVMARGAEVPAST